MTSSFLVHVFTFQHNKMSQTHLELLLPWLSLVAQMVKNLPAMQETQARSLDREDPLKENLATHSSVLAWRMPWTDATDHGVAKSQTRLLSK